MKANPEQLRQLGEIGQRCQLAQLQGEARAEATLAGLVTAAAILLPPTQWEHFCRLVELEPERLGELVALVPRAEVDGDQLMVDGKTEAEQPVIEA